MTGYLRFAARHPLPILLIVAALSVLALMQLPRLQVQVSSQGLMVQDPALRQFYQRTLDTFGSDHVTILFLHDPELFSPARLTAIREVLDRLEALEFVSGTDSLFSVPNLKVVDGYLLSDPFLAATDETAGLMAPDLGAALRNPLVRRNLLSEDGMTMAVNIRIRPEVTTQVSESYIAEQIDSTIAPLQHELQEVFQIGTPYVHQIITDQIEEDQRNILPLSFLVLFLTLILMLRRASGALIPLVTAGISILWTLAFMVLADIPVNVVTAIVPAILIIIGSTEDIHLIAEFYKARDQGAQGFDAIDYMAGRMGLAITLTFITSYLGFLSIAANRIELLWQFGLTASTGLLFNFLLTVSLVPILLRLSARGMPAAGIRTLQAPFQKTAKMICNVVHHPARRRTAFLLFILLTGVVGYGAVHLEINNNVLEYFPADSPIKQHDEALHQKLAGQETFSIVLDSRIQGTFLQARYLDELRKLQEYLRTTGRIDAATSFADYLTLMNSVMIESDELVPPEDDDVIGELMLLLRHEHVAQYVSEDYSSARIMVRHSVHSSREFRQLLDELNEYIAREIDPGLNTQTTGESVLINRSVDFIAIGQAKSLLVMITVIFAIISILFLNIRVGFLAVLPNIFPIVCLFGVMGHAGIQMDVGTAMVAAIAIGICVDNTIHLMVRYQRELREQRDESSAMFNTISAEVVPISATSISLALGFATLTLSGFTPVVYFGALSAMVMLLSLLANFLITPVLLRTTHLITVWDMLSVRLRSELSAHNELFHDMRPWHIRKMVLFSEIREYRAGQTIFQQGDDAKNMIILLDGQVELHINHHNGSVEVYDKVTVGRLFGEDAFLSDSERLADAVAMTDCRVLVISWQTLQRVVRIYPHLASLMYKNLSLALGKRFAERVKDK